MATTVVPNVAVVAPSPSPPSALPSGILLKDSLGPQPRHRHDSAVASSSTSTSSSSNSRSPSTERSPRRIRFAPLPAPRRDEQQVPDSPFFPDDSDSDQPSALLAPAASFPETPPSPRLLPLLHSDDLNPKSKSLSWGQKLLRPLLPSRKPSPPTSDVALLRHIPSHDSFKDASAQSQYKGGVPLGRRMSTGNTAIKYCKEAERATTYRDGAPLHPVFSETNQLKPRNGQRMLNGRVYGRRTNPSSAARDSYEPEFVEWGYGGMGSNNSHHASGSTHGLDWAKVQSRGKVIVGGTSRDGDEDFDDGSGMGWVRRRREQRERERRAKEERDNAAAINPPNANPATQQQEDQHQDHENGTLPEIAVYPPPDASSRKSSADKALEEHLCEAISIPAPYHHHHYRLKDSNAPTPVAVSRDNSASTLTTRAALSPPSTQDEGSVSSGSSVTSASSVEDDEDEDDDTERESDDEDDEAQGRLTSKGAGVEKISRHKE